MVCGSEEHIPWDAAPRHSDDGVDVGASRGRRTLEVGSEVEGEDPGVGGDKQIANVGPASDLVTRDLVRRVQVLGNDRAGGPLVLLRLQGRGGDDGPLVDVDHCDGDRLRVGGLHPAARAAGRRDLDGVLALGLEIGSGIEGERPRDWIDGELVPVGPAGYRVAGDGVHAVLVTGSHGAGVRLVLLRREGRGGDSGPVVGVDHGYGDRLRVGGQRPAARAAHDRDHDGVDVGARRRPRVLEVGRVVEGQRSRARVYGKLAGIGPAKREIGDFVVVRVRGGHGAGGRLVLRRLQGRGGDDRRLVGNDLGISREGRRRDSCRGGQRHRGESGCYPPDAVGQRIARLRSAGAAE